MHGARERDGRKVLRPSLHADQSGIALIYVTAMLPLIIGFALLAVDVGRFMTLNSSLQHGADALALAGAAELDGRQDAITRSEGAMKLFIKNNTALFATSVTKVDWSAVKTCYLASLPASDSTPIAKANCLPMANAAEIKASSPTAKFVQVLVNPTNYDTIFPATFVGALSNTSQTNAEAVAGFQAAVCNFTPLFMCNPFEPTTGTTNTLDSYGLDDFIADPKKRNRAIRFIAVGTGNSTTATPGQYGFLDPATGNGKKALGDEIASVSPDVCYIQNKLQTKTGDMTDLRNAFNTRFDLYFGSYKKTDYPPAGNVRKGYIAAKTSGNANNLKYQQGDACNTNDNVPALNPNAFLGMPVDSCFKDDSCKNPDTGATWSIGNGNWDYDPVIAQTNSTLASTPYVSFTQYWKTNFQSQTPTAPVPSESDLGLGTSTAAYTDTNVPPRYDVYKYENTKKVGSQLLRDFKTKSTTAAPTVTGAITYNSTGSTNLGEVGGPQCSTTYTDNPDRRIVYGAIVNCRAEKLSPGGGGYTAFAFGKFFMIRPMPSTNNSELWLELVDVVRPGDGTGVARDIVQLYR